MNKGKTSAGCGLGKLVATKLAAKHYDVITVPNSKILDLRSPVEKIMGEGFERIDAIFDECIDKLDDLGKTYDVGFFGLWEGKPVGYILYRVLQDNQLISQLEAINNKYK